jgi:hypothetical protein
LNPPPLPYKDTASGPSPASCSLFFSISLSPYLASPRFSHRTCLAPGQSEIRKKNSLPQNLQQKTHKKPEPKKPPERPKNTRIENKEKKLESKNPEKNPEHHSMEWADMNALFRSAK